MLRIELAILHEEDYNLDLVGFYDIELQRLLEAQDAAPGLIDEDAVPDVQQEPVARLGDLFVLGDHRVICGDCTQPRTSPGLAWLYGQQFLRSCSIGLLCGFLFHAASIHHSKCFGHQAKKPPARGRWWLRRERSSAGLALDVVRPLVADLLAGDGQPVLPGQRTARAQHGLRRVLLPELAVMISSSVVPPSRLSIAITWLVLLPSRGAPASFAFVATRFEE
jgi:hypothetical protein